MAHYEAAALSRVFYGWWVAAAFSLIVFLSTGARFAVGPFLKPVAMTSTLGAWLAGFLFDLSGGYGLAFAAACGLLMVGAGLSLTISVAGRRRARRELQPVAGGR